jgi:hypothetical protein
MRHAQKVAESKLFQSETITKREITGEVVIGGLLDIFSDVVTELCNKDFDPSELKGRPAWPD